MDKVLLRSVFVFLGLFAWCSAGELSEEIFTHIYDVGLWGKDQNGKGTSGGGSSFESAVEYIVFLNKFIKANDIKSIVEIGCGDWEVMSHVDLSNVNYMGFDVVKSVIDGLIEKYSSSNVRFAFADCINDSLPKADLLLCKDVLIHLTNKDVFKIIKKFKDYKHVLVTTDVEASNLTSCNRDIALGDWREVDLSAPPFNQAGKKILIYPATHSYHHLKQVFYVFNAFKDKDCEIVK